MEVLTLSKFNNPKLLKLLDAKDSPRAVQRMLELAGRAKGYTAPIATGNNSKEKILGYISTQIEKVNQLGMKDLEKADALDEMWQDYMRVQGMPDNIFGGNSSGRGKEIGMTQDIATVRGGDQGVSGTKSTTGGLLDEGGTFDGETFLDGTGDGY